MFEGRNRRCSEGHNVHLIASSSDLKTMPPRLFAASLTLGELLGENSRYSVPDFQRPYSWKREHAQQLLDDLTAACGADDEERAKADYFLGTLLLLAEPGTPPPASPAPADKQQLPCDYAIVDGQQRMVTLNIIAAILRDNAPEGATYVDALNALIETAGGRGFRIELSGDSHEFLDRYVLARGATLLPIEEINDLVPSTRRLADVRDEINDTLIEMPAPNRERLAFFLLQCCHFIVTLTHDIDRAHSMFVVLNERGKPLSTHDIIKAEIQAQIVADDYRKKIVRWDELERLLGADFESLLSHLAKAHGQSNANDQKIIASIRTLIAESGDASTFLDSFLFPFADNLARVRALATPGSTANDLSAHIVSLTRLRGEEWLPPVVTAFELHSSDPDTLISLVAGIERLTYVLRLAGEQSNRRMARMHSVAMAIRRGAALSGDHDILLPRPDQARKAAAKLRAIDNEVKKLCKPLLLRLSDLVGDEVCAADANELSLEHVYPLHPPRSGDDPITDVEARRAATHSIGNFAIIPTRLNGKLGNAWFPQKRAYLIENLKDGENLAITRDMLAATEWSLEAIAEREARFLRILSDFLRIDLRGSASAGEQAERVFASRKAAQ
ncbi:MAG: DUF262 domain-containing protein [Hyphomicrobiaceae bacterium]